jgi:Holliday junction DNA helicase RuvA
MLSVLSPNDVRSAVAAEDLVTLTKVPGIGKKGAQRLVIELKDKLGAPATVGGLASRSPSAAAPQWQTQVHTALLGLGWSARDADSAIEKVAPMAQENGHSADIPELLKAALRTLAKS